MEFLSISDQAREVGKTSSVALSVDDEMNLLGLGVIPLVAVCTADDMEKNGSITPQHTRVNLTDWKNIIE